LKFDIMRRRRRKGDGGGEGEKGEREEEKGIGGWGGEVFLARICCGFVVRDVLYTG
jgi:hypothetical protein